MTRLMLFLHLFGTALWIGGGAAAMLLAVGARQESAAVQAGVLRLAARVHAYVVGAGALAVVGTGLWLTARLVTTGAGSMMSAPRVWVMQGAGLVAGALVLLVGVPTAVRLGRLARVSAEEAASAVERLRRRQAVVSSIAGTLAVVALFAATAL